MGHLFENFCVSLVNLVLISAKIQDSLQDEITENTLSVTFSKVSQVLWRSSGYETKFRIKIASLINSFCPNNTRHCGLTFWNNTRKFTSDDVAIVGYNSRQDHLEVNFFNHLPEGFDIREDFKTVVPAAILERILWQRKNEISSAVGVSVLSVGENNGDSATDSDNTSVRLLNFIMIPISFAALIIVSLLAWCLHYCQKMKMKSLETDRRKQLAMKNKTQQLHFTGAVSKQDSAEKGMQQIYDSNKNSYTDKDNPGIYNREGKSHFSSHGEQESKKKYKKQMKTSLSIKETMKLGT